MQLFATLKGNQPTTTRNPRDWQGIPLSFPYLYLATKTIPLPGQRQRVIGTF